MEPLLEAIRIFDLMEAKKIDPNKIKAMQKMDYQSALKSAMDIIDASNTDKIRKSALLQSLSNTRSTMDVMRLMYNLILSGEGHSVIDSDYQKKFK